jgi:hypothetical protein
MKQLLLLMLLLPSTLYAQIDFSHALRSVDILETAQLTLTIYCADTGVVCDMYDLNLKMVVQMRPLYIGWREDLPYRTDWMDWQSVTQRGMMEYVAATDGTTYLQFQYAGELHPSQMPAPMSVRYRLELDGEKSAWYITQVAQPAYTVGDGVVLTDFCINIPASTCVFSFVGDVGAYQTKMEYLTNSSGWQVVSPDGVGEWTPLTAVPSWARQTFGDADCSGLFPDAEGSTRFTYRDSIGTTSITYAGPNILGDCGV